MLEFAGANSQHIAIAGCLRKLPSIKENEKKQDRLINE